jgi:hypothetical protein
MSKALTAEYDPETCSLRLLEPLEGFVKRERVSVIVDHEPKKRWSDLENVLKGELGESFASAIDEAYPIEPVKR